MEEKKRFAIIKGTITTLLVGAAALIIIFLIGRYGWKLFGFSVCESAGIESVEVEDGQVRITGFYPGSFPQGFLGYHAEEKDGTLYVGFKFSGLFGIFETGDFDITIPTRGKINEVYIKTSQSEYLIWSSAPETDPGMTEETDPGANEQTDPGKVEETDPTEIEEPILFTTKPLDCIHPKRNCC